MIGILGLNHQCAGAAIREKFCFVNEAEKVRFQKMLAKDNGMESLILSTCNRTEIYFKTNKNCASRNFNHILKHLIDFKQADPDLEKYFYYHTDKQACLHLFRVICGLDSMILGEDQIQAQIKEAYRISVSGKFSGTVLNRLLHKAIELGKKARNQTRINKGISSVSGAAIQFAEQNLPDFTQARYLLIGTGKMGQLLLKSLVTKNCQSIRLINRNYEKAARIGQEHNLEAVPWAELDTELTLADVVVLSTASATPVLTSKSICSIMHQRNRKPLLLIDISLPRNVETGVQSIPDTRIIWLDDLKKTMAQTMQKKHAEIEKVEILIQAAVEEFFQWLETLNIHPILKALKSKLEKITLKEKKRLQQQVSEEEYQKIIEFSDYMMDKHIRLIANNLMQLTDKGRKVEYIDHINKLYSLQENHD